MKATLIIACMSTLVISSNSQILLPKISSGLKKLEKIANNIIGIKSTASTPSGSIGTENHHHHPYNHGSNVEYPSNAQDYNHPAYPQQGFGQPSVFQNNNHGSNVEHPGNIQDSRYPAQPQQGFTQPGNFQNNPGSTFEHTGNIQNAKYPVQPQQGFTQPGNFQNNPGSTFEHTGNIQNAKYPTQPQQGFPQPSFSHSTINPSLKPSRKPEDKTEVPHHDYDLRIHPADGSQTTKGPIHSEKSDHKDSNPIPSQNAQSDLKGTQPQSQSTVHSDSKGTQPNPSQNNVESDVKEVQPSASQNDSHSDLNPHTSQSKDALESPDHKLGDEKKEDSISSTKANLPPRPANAGVSSSQDIVKNNVTSVTNDGSVVFPDDDFTPNAAVVNNTRVCVAGQVYPPDHPCGKSTDARVVCVEGSTLDENNKCRPDL